MKPVDAPLLSVIVIAQNNEATIARTVSSIATQSCPRPFEIILVDSGSDKTVDIVRANFPEVGILDLSKPVFPGKARNEGLKIARGDFVSFPGSHIELPPGSLAARMAAHEKGYAMVTGAIINGTDTRAGWASYFMDHAASLPERPSGPLDSPPNSCSYDRRVLMRSGPFPEDRRAGEDTVVNQRLWDAGHRAYRDNGIKLVHVTRSRTPGRLAYHHFIRGRAWGRILAERGRDAGELSGYLNRRLTFIEDCLRRWGGLLTDRYFEAKPLIRLGVASAWIGAHSALATQRQTLGKRHQDDQAADTSKVSPRGSPAPSSEFANHYQTSGKRESGKAP
jgi:glycosyltransferase involved in cell wall biosynthesis